MTPSGRCPSIGTGSRAGTRSPCRGRLGSSISPAAGRGSSGGRTSTTASFGARSATRCCARADRELAMADAARVEALYREARGLCQQGLIARGVDLLKEAIALDPTQGRSHRLLGMALAQIGRHQEALVSLDRAIALGAVDADGSRADTLVALGRLAEAIASFDRALAVDPNSVVDWCNRGAALLDLSRAA